MCPASSHRPRYRHDTVAAILATAAIAGAPFAARAQGAADEGAPTALAETVVTANRVPEASADSLSAVRVIGPRELAGSGAMTLGEVLRQYGGVEVAAAGGPGQITSVFVRGANPNQTLVLVDGMRLQSASAGTTALENLPVSQIERIEVVPGPASGLYGSDAIGGVIQVFTKGATKGNGSEVELGLGSFQTGRAQAGTRGNAGSVDYAISAGYLGSEAFSATNPSIPFGLYNADRDPYRNRNLSAHLGWNWDTDHVLAVRVFRSTAATHFDNGPATDDVALQTLSQVAVSSEDRLTSNWSSSLQFGSSRDSYYAAAFGTTESVQRQLGWQNTLTLAGVGTVIAGLEDLNESVAGDTVFSVTQRDTRAGYLGWSEAFGPGSLRANLRHAENSQFGSVNTGSLAAGWRFDDHWRVRASYGSGFHAPTFNDLYASYPPYYYANPNLRPERSHNTEVGIDANFGGQHASLAVFDNRISSLIAIVNDPAVTGAQTVVNVASARIRGIEAEWDGAAGGTRWDLRGTLQDPVDAATGLRLTRRATRFGTARLSRTEFGIDWTVEAQAVGERFDAASQDPATRMGGYGLINLVAARRLAPEWRAEVRFNNVTDHRYVLEQGYNVPSSSLFASLVWSSQ
ncbi:MAG: TonB-dependent receptor [Pseudomonadota bacterium]|nr:TonB-dependent receptor [Pseudomonadota bacterium]